MEFNELIRARYSCRSYTAEPVSREEIEAILSETVLAPSACNSQPWYFSVLLSEEIRAAGAQAVVVFPPANVFAKEAAALVVFSALKQPVLSQRSLTKYPPDHFAEIDIGIAAAHFTLAAADRGLGTCILGAFDEEKIAALAKLPDTVVPKLVIAVGHPADTGAQHVKKRTPAAEKTDIF